MGGISLEPFHDPYAGQCNSSNMTADSIEKDSIRSLSPIVIDDSQRRHGTCLLACCGCSRTGVNRGFFRRIFAFKVRKRPNSVHKQQLSNGCPIPETIEQSSTIISPISQPTRYLNSGLDSYSFNDIEAAPSINELKTLNCNATPRSIASRNYSLATTNLSAYSSQSLLRKLLDKAQILDEYYKDLPHKTSLHSSSSLSASLNSIVRKSDRPSRAYLHRYRSSDSMRKSRQRKYRNQHDNLSSNSSRFDLYDDEDNILRELIRFNNDLDLILSQLETEGEHVQAISHEPEEIEQTIITMRTDTNDLNVQALLAEDINRLRETALTKLLKMSEWNHETITLNKLNKLPKSPTWKGKHTFGVPLRIYQQTTGHLLPIGIVNAFEYIRLHAGKCDGLFRKPGVKSKIDRLRAEIERSDSSFDIIKFDEYQPFVVADVIRQYFRELPECLIPPLITRLLCDLLKCVSSEEQLLAIRYTFLLLADETREVLELILRFLLDVSIRLGNSQVTCRSLARIFLPSVFQSYYHLPPSSSKIHWWKWKREKFDGLQQENERLVLEQCLMTMILNVDLLVRVPSALRDELNLPSVKTMKRLDELIRDECNGDFHLKKYTSTKTEQFLQCLSNRKFKTVPTNIDGVSVAIHKSSVNPTWKCSMEIPNTSAKQIHQRILYEQYRWQSYFAEGRIIEKIENDKEIIQYVFNSNDLQSIRSFCEFRFSKKVTSRSTPDTNSILISSTSIDHIQNHFLPGNTGITYDMYYYLTPSTTNPANTTITQIACVDYSGRSSQWYETIYGFLLAHNLRSLRDTFTNTKIAQV